MDLANPSRSSSPFYPDPDTHPAWVEAVRQRLVSWYETAARPLPWRETHDPYRILVSEMMLVQTTVAAVIPFYARFLDRFPTVERLAEAEESEVLKAWEGLGYYRRARQLHEAARAVVRDHGGTFPTDPALIRALPGVGRYITGALLSFAFDQPAPIVEANTQRVLARWLAWESDLKTTASQTRLWQAAERLVPDSGSGIFNQAFMELGALVCVPRAPLCLACPVASECQSRRLGLQDRLPVASPRAVPKEVAEACIVVARDGRVLLVQRDKDRLWAHFWEFPTLHQGGHDPAGRSLGEPLDLAVGLQRLTGIVARVGPRSKTIRFGVTTHKVSLDIHPAEWEAGEPVPGPGLVRAAWVKPEEIATYTLGAASRRVAADLLLPPK